MKKRSLFLGFALILIFFSTAFGMTAAELLHLGNVAGRHKKYRDAIDYYTQAIKLDGKLPNAYYNRGYVYIEIRKYKLALKDLDRAIELKKDYSAAYHVRGIAYFYIKKYNQAIADYSHAIKLDPGNIRLYYSRMSAYFKTGDGEGAWKDVIKIQHLGGTVNPLIINILKGKNYRE